MEALKGHPLYIQMKNDYLFSYVSATNVEAESEKTYLLLQCPLQRVHLHLLFTQTGLVGGLLLLGFGPHLCYL